MLRLEAETTAGAIRLDVHLEVDAGTCLAIAGPSGAGKTTLLRIIAGLTRPERGRVISDGTSWLDTERDVDLPPERRRVGFVFQDYALFPHLSAAANVAYAVTGAPRAERASRAAELLERLGVDSATAARRPGALSGGERQRVALARALAREPDVLLMDEPLAALDPRTRARAARELAAALGQIAAPTLLVTHDFAEAATLGSEVAVIDAGSVVQKGAAAQLAAEPASAFVADFTGAVVMTGEAEPGAEGLTMVALDGGGTVVTTDSATGPVGVSVYPWEISLEPALVSPAGSAQNHVRARVASLTPLGNRVRVGLTAAQPLTAEITAASAARLGLKAGDHVVATWKATATRLVAL
jgi:molybdate transport system ATP-binding protein